LTGSLHADGAHIKRSDRDQYELNVSALAFQARLHTSTAVTPVHVSITHESVGPAEHSLKHVVDISFRDTTTDPLILCQWSSCRERFRLSSFDDHWRTHSAEDTRQGCLWHGCTSQAKVCAAFAGAERMLTDSRIRSSTCMTGILAFATSAGCATAQTLPRYVRSFVTRSRTAGASLQALVLCSACIVGCRGLARRA
jgi:hypothetical protein